MVEITIHSPFQALFDLEARCPGGDRPRARSDHADVPRPIPQTILQQVGARRREPAARDAPGRRHHRHHRRQGASARWSRTLQPERAFAVEVVPLTGGVQGKHYTDVNHVATQMADKLGGTAILIHAPLFADSRRAARHADGDDVGHATSSTSPARRAIAVVGIGSILRRDSSYYDLHPTRRRRPRAADRAAACAANCSPI